MWGCPCSVTGEPSLGVQHVGALLLSLPTTTHTAGYDCELDDSQRRRRDRCRAPRATQPPLQGGFTLSCIAVGPLSTTLGTSVRRIATGSAHRKTNLLSG
jgi:hypothetical protein